MALWAMWPVVPITSDRCSFPDWLNLCRSSEELLDTSVSALMRISICLGVVNSKLMAVNLHVSRAGLQDVHRFESQLNYIGKIFAWMLYHLKQFTPCRQRVKHLSSSSSHAITLFLRWMNEALSIRLFFLITHSLHLDGCQVHDHGRGGNSVSLLYGCTVIYHPWGKTIIHNKTETSTLFSYKEKSCIQKSEIVLKG